MGLRSAIHKALQVTLVPQECEGCLRYFICVCKAYEDEGFTTKSYRRFWRWAFPLFVLCQQLSSFQVTIFSPVLLTTLFVTALALLITIPVLLDAAPLQRTSLLVEVALVALVFKFLLPTSWLSALLEGELASVWVYCLLIPKPKNKENDTHEKDVRRAKMGIVVGLSVFLFRVLQSFLWSRANHRMYAPVPSTVTAITAAVLPITFCEFYDLHYTKWARTVLFSVAGVIFDNLTSAPVYKTPSGKLIHMPIPLPKLAVTTAIFMVLNYYAGVPIVRISAFVSTVMILFGKRWWFGGVELNFSLFYQPVLMWYSLFVPDADRRDKIPLFKTLRRRFDSKFEPLTGIELDAASPEENVRKRPKLLLKRGVFVLVMWLSICKLYDLLVHYTTSHGEVARFDVVLHFMVLVVMLARTFVCCGHRATAAEAVLTIVLLVIAEMIRIGFSIDTAVKKQTRSGRGWENVATGGFALGFTWLDRGAMIIGIMVFVTEMVLALVYIKEKAFTTGETVRVFCSSTLLHDEEEKLGGKKPTANNTNKEGGSASNAAAGPKRHFNPGATANSARFRRR